ncbi:MAG TPA: hypothetical protein VF007_10910 [Stellaceae bacterium]
MNAAPTLCAMLLLAACSGGGDWVKPGADEAAAASEYQECRDLAGTAVRTQADIDQDIAATRSDDRQRGSVVRLQTETQREQTRDRAAGIVARCMAAKGFTQPP